MSTLLKNAVNGKDHMRGLVTAPLEIVEYGDYECPVCGLAFVELHKIREAIGDDIKFVFRNFPLTEIHPNAFNAALAAEAAGLQGKFWQMHDRLLRRQRYLTPGDLLVHAEETGLNTDQFNTDIKKEALEKKIADDYDGGISNGVNGTPTFYINGEKYEGDWGHETVIAHLKTLLAHL